MAKRSRTQAAKRGAPPTATDSMPAATPPRPRVARCKRYHAALSREEPGDRRTLGDRKSRCPGWADNNRLRDLLLDEALVEESAGQTWAGHPKRLWNAIEGWTFVAVSTNEAVPAYNCYPEIPTAFIEELATRAERAVEDVLPGGLRA
ncbi:MAG: hypothetical protein HY908_34600 [Myxococcales bacterium]|nr:hypothetical protein [Myxococcales bacterium]